MTIEIVLFIVAGFVIFSMASYGFNSSLKRVENQQKAIDRADRELFDKAVKEAYSRLLEKERKQ